SGIVAHVSESLHDDPFAFQAGCQAYFLHVFGNAYAFLDGHGHAASRGGPPACDTMEGEGLARDTGEVVHLARVHCRIRIGNPAHLTLARAVVRRRYVDGRANEVLLDQFDRIATRDGFQLRHGIVFWIDSDAAFGTPERHVDDRAFIGHKGRQSHHLVLVDQLAVADSAL